LWLKLLMKRSSNRYHSQVITLLFQDGVDPGVTDMLVMMMEEK